jgi:hypothetical protein
VRLFGSRILTAYIHERTLLAWVETIAISLIFPATGALECKGLHYLSTQPETRPQNG